MKKLLSAMFVALLMVGCGSPDLDDTETLDEIIAEAIDWDKMQKRGEKGKELLYAPNEQTPYSGWQKKMHDNGQVSHLGKFKDGKSEGLSTFWYDNGQKWSEGTHKNGKSEGLLTEWHENGVKKSEQNYKDGKLDGLKIEWYDNGQKWTVTNYKDGEKDGLWTSWYENGQKRLEMSYKNGKIVED